jgi:cyclopropane fatty-acyl-phospholipid synthase-like methyltransferase
MTKRELLIGCGSNHEKRLTCDGSQVWENLTTLDYNPDHKPDVVWDLMSVSGLPFESDTFDEIHAYEVLEHTGAQGDYKFFFWQFSDFWRVLKPNGHLLVTCPSRHSVWALGDPSHTRVLQKEMLIFLDQDAYKEVGKTSISDFRSIYKAHFKHVHVNENQDEFHFVLKAIK